MTTAVVSSVVLAGFLFAQAQTVECAALNRSITQNRKMLTVFRSDPPGPLNRYAFGAVVGGVVGAVMFGLFSHPPGTFEVQIENGDEFKGHQEFNWVFSPDLKRYAFISFRGGAFAKGGGEFLVVLDGKPSEKYRAIKGPVFSADSAESSFVGLRYRKPGFSFAKKWDLLLGSETKGPFEDAEPPRYSHDGRRRTYSVKEKDRWTLFENDQPLPQSYDELALVGYGEHSNRLVVGGMREGKWLVDFDGKTFLQLSRPLSVLEGGPSQVPVVIRSETENTGLRELAQRFVISHGSQDFGPYKQVSQLLTSPVSERFVFAAKDKEDQWLIHTGTSLKGPYADTRMLAVKSWTPEGPEWAYGAKVGQSYRLFKPDGDEGGWEDMAGPFAIGTDGIAYAYKSGADWRVKLRGETLGPFLQVAYLPQLWQTSPDHKHLAFPARDQKGWSVVVDGVKGPITGEDVLAIRWIDASKLRYWMARDPGPTKRNAKVRQAYHLIEEDIR